MWRGIQIYTGVNELYSYGQLSTNAVEGTMAPEIHRRHYEFLFMRSGTRNIDILTRGSVQITGGELLVIRPNEEHSDSTNQTRFSLDYIIFCDPRVEDCYTFLDKGERTELISMLDTLPDVPFRISKKAVDLFDDLHALVADFDLPLRTARIRSVLLLLITEVVFSSRELRKNNPAADIMNAVKFIEEHPSYIPSVEELAAAVHLSESRFKQKFKHEMGIPPKEYLLRFKLQQAKQLLNESSLSVSEIASRLGFSSGQHLSVQFRQRTGMTPLQYRHRYVKEIGKDDPAEYADPYPEDE